MNIDIKTLEKIAHLARLQLNEEDTAQMQRDLTKMLNFVEKLNEVDTEGVEPLTTMSHEVNMLRDDEVKGSLPHEDALSSAPHKDSQFFHVPKVLE